MTHLIELQRKRLSLIDEARAKLDQIKNCTDDAKADKLGREHDAILRELDLIDLDIREAQADADSEQQRKERRPNGGDGEVRGADNGGYAIARDGWADKQGNEIRALTRSDRFASDRWEGPSLGSIMRAMITGPRNDNERRALAEGTDSAGGYTVPAPLAASFIDKLRAQSVLIRAGAITVPMTSATLGIAKLATDPTAAWKAENDPIDDSDPTFARVQLEAKTLIGLVKLSRELADDSVNIAQMLEAAFVGAAAVEFDRAGLFGSGSGAEPLGIASAVGINEVSMGTNGAALTNFDPLIDGAVKIMEANADPVAAIMSPRTAGALAKLKDGQNNPLTRPAMLDPITNLVTTSVPNNQTQGTATNASSILMGAWQHLIIGMRSELRIELLRETFAANHQYGFVFHMRGDFQPAHANAFTRIVGIKPA